MSAAQMQDVQQQQAQVAGMLAQLPPEQQVQIQEVVGAYNHQLSAQGVAPEAVQSYVWSYYTQCVTSFYQQLQAAQMQQAQQEQSLAQQEPRRSEEELQALQQALDEELKSPEVVPKDLFAAKPTSAQLSEPQQAGTQPSANGLQTKNSDAENVQAQREFKDPQQEVQKQYEQRIDPMLAKRFAKQREKEHQDAVVEESPACSSSGTKAVADPVRPAAASSTPSKTIDPVLAKRWNALQEREAAGEQAAKAIDEAIMSSKKEKPAESELAKRMAKQQEKVKERLEKYGDIDASAAGQGAALNIPLKPWEARQAAAQAAAQSELAERQAKQQEKKAQQQLEEQAIAAATANTTPEAVPAIDSTAAASEVNATASSAESGGAPQLVEAPPLTVKEAGASGDAPVEAERTRLSLPAGKTAMHIFTWPKDSLRLSCLRWHALVLNSDLDFEMEVIAELRPETDDAAADSIVLQKNARGSVFDGSFAPLRDRRFAPASPANGSANRTSREVRAIVFKFSNAFSWFTAKDVELITMPDD
jgi:DNA polymerase III gamma/tau subunit